jgi:hypothetical protein
MPDSSDDVHAKESGHYQLEMYLAGISVRRVEDITEARWGG